MRRRTLLGSLAASLVQVAATDQYGGWTDIRLRATGYFRADRVRGRHVLVTPEGHPYIAFGANHVGAFFNHPRQSAQILGRFGGDRAKAEVALLAALQDLGFNAGEAYDPLLPSFKAHLPRFENLEFPGRQKFRFDVFDPGFQQELRAYTIQQCQDFRTDPWVMGVTYVDLPVWNQERIKYFQQLPASAPGAVAYRKARAAGRSDEQFFGQVAEVLYLHMRRAVRAGAPNHLFAGERFVLRMVPEPVLQAVGRHVDLFATQSIILSPHRPPEWQTFQAEGYRRDHQLTSRKPMVIIDWPTPFSLDTTYDTERGTVKDERTATDEAVQFMELAFREDYIVGLFACQIIGSHGNDRWFPEGRMKRTYLRDDGTPFPYRTRRLAEGHAAVLSQIRRRLAGR